MRNPGSKKLTLFLSAFCALLIFSPSFAFDFLDEDIPELPPVNSTFIDADIREALRTISNQVGVKIIPDETVTGKVSIDLKTVPFEEALRMILSAKDYSFRKMPEGYYLVGLCVPSSPSFSRLSVTESIRPQHLKAKEIQSLLPEFYQPYVKVNEDINSLTITASPDLVERFKKDFSKFDITQRQIMIEALVVELNSAAKKSLGVTWGSMLDGGYSVFPPQVSANKKPDAPEGSWNIPGIFSTDLLVRINALIETGAAIVRANPKVATLEGKQAEIYVGTEEYFLVNVGQAAKASYAMQSISTGVVLKITPFLDDKNQITLTLAPEVSEVTKNSSDLPIVNRRSASTSLRVSENQTIAIGGLIQEDERASHSQKGPKGKEVVIFITPRIMNQKQISSKIDDFLASSKKNESEMSKALATFEKLKTQKNYRTKSLNLGNREQARNIAVKDPVKQYYFQIRDIIYNQRRFPGHLKNEQKSTSNEVVIGFTIFSNGLIDDIVVEKSSGSADVDMMTIELIQKIAPFPPFPAGMRQTSVHFVLPIQYEI